MLPRTKHIDPIEKKCLNHIVDNYNIKYTEGGQNVDSLAIRKTTLKYWNMDVVILQPPFTNYSGNRKYSDFTIHCPSRKIDNRYEVSSLTVTSELEARFTTLIKHSKELPENHLYLILIGVGYDNIVKHELLPMIKSNNLPVTIFRTIHEFKKHIKTVLN